MGVGAGARGWQDTGDGWKGDPAASAVRCHSLGLPPIALPPHPSSMGFLPPHTEDKVRPCLVKAFPANSGSSLITYLTHSKPGPPTASRSLRRLLFQASEHLNKLFPLPGMPPPVSSWGTPIHPSQFSSEHPAHQITTLILRIATFAAHLFSGPVTL